MKDPFHILMIGRDDTVFYENSGSDTRQRLVYYLTLAKEHHKNAIITYLVIGKDIGQHHLSLGDLTLTSASLKKHSEIGKFLKKLKSIHQENPVNVISPQNVGEEGLFVLAFSKWNKIPIVGQIHYDIFSDFAKQGIFGTGAVATVHYNLSKYSLLYYDAIRVVGSRIKKKIESNPKFKGHVELIPVPVTIEAAETKNPSKRDWIIFVGRLVEVKNLSFWVEVIHEFSKLKPNFNFAIIGDGPCREKLEQQVQRLGLNEKIHFTGSINHKDLHQWYQKAAIFLLTSHYEGFGRVIVEAAKFNVPTVAPIITGAEDIILQGETGYLCPANQLNAFVDALMKAIQNFEELGEKAHTRVNRLYDPNLLAKQWIELLIKTA